MIGRTLQSAFLLLVIATGAAAPWVIHRAAAASLRERETRLQQQTARLARLVAENERLSNLVARADAPALSTEQLGELLKLRSEAGALRGQTNAMQRLREENRELQSRATNAQSAASQRSPAELDAELSIETIEAMRNVCRWLPQALQMFGNEHDHKAPADFAELRQFFPKPDGRRITGLYTFEFIRDDGPLPGDALILRERSARQNLDGQWTRVYGFADGRAIEATSDDREFKTWEKQHLGPPPAD